MTCVRATHIPYRALRADPRHPVYDDADYDRVFDQMESASPYGLTGSIIAQDRRAIADATAKLRFAVGNFYINDKPTGAVVGQQPFGGGRVSGTNDKAGAAENLLRWTRVRSMKETLVPRLSMLEVQFGPSRPTTHGVATDVIGPQPW